MVTTSNKSALFAGLAALAALCPAPARVRAQGIETKLFAEMKWHPIGPFRCGRTKAITGVRGQPNVFD